LRKAKCCPQRRLSPGLKKGGALPGGCKNPREEGQGAETSKNEQRKEVPLPYLNNKRGKKGGGQEVPNKRKREKSNG